MAKIIVVDEDRCVGCKSCVIQCAIAHSQAKTLVGALSCDPPAQPRMYVEQAGDLAMPLQCHHCTNAPCLRVCPTGALWREIEGTGPVLLASDRCVGCRRCLVVCPFGMIDVAADGKTVIKCDLCIDRTDAGELPACVEACPTQAIRFVELDDQLRLERREAARYIINEEECKACGMCVRVCPTEAISDGLEKIPALIDPEKCIQCGLCRQSCKFDAVMIIGD